MKSKILFVLLISFFVELPFVLQAQEFTQNIRGRVVDKQTQIPLTGATIRLLDSTQNKGTITGANGYFLLEDVKTGRVSLEIRFIGYFPCLLNNLNLTTGKELVLNINLEERVIQTQEVVVTAKKEKTKPNNELANVSARQFTIEESQRYAGARNDVSRMATNYAGVSTANDAVNDIVIRGNSPAGLLWMLEGVPIPNPNHYGGMGATGGPVSMLNNNVLSNSDFITSAFPAEYGNALSGVFDLELRNGNYEKHEFLGQMGFNGFEIGIEGPVSRENRASYLANYRYSMLGIASALGVSFGTGTAIPYYQDLSFKVHLPTQKAGRFNIFGLGGKNSIDFNKSEAEEDDSENFYDEDYLDTYNENQMGVLGISHAFVFNETAYTKLILSASHIGNHTLIDSFNRHENTITDYMNMHYKNTNLTGHLYFNKKFSSKHHLRIGTQAISKHFDMIDSIWIAKDNRFFSNMNDEGSTQLYQSYAQWLYRINDRFSINGGLHYSFLALNNNSSLEPRVGLKWQIAANKSINIGYGLHSQMFPVYTYLSRAKLDNGGYVLPNKNLNFVKSHHYVLGYDWNIMPALRVKAETYYQSIFDAAVEPTQSAYSMINTSSMTWNFPDSLVNGGSGRNYGLEITVEKFLDKGLYYLFTASLFDSKYKGSDGKLRSTTFDSKYVINFLGGKEFELFTKQKNATTRKWLTVDASITAAGGQRYVPIDLEASQQFGTTKYDWDRAYTEKFSDYFRADVRVAFRLDGKNISQEWAFDVQNITNHKNPLRKTYNIATAKPETTYQLGLFPMVQYRITF